MLSLLKVVDLSLFSPEENNLVILDDLLEECEANIQIQTLFTVDSHHKNISTFFMTQNLFSRGKCFRTISLNCDYFILFKSPRDPSQVHHFSRQVFPTRSKFFVEAFEDATSQPYGHLLLDMTQTACENQRVQGNIIKKRAIYTPKNL